MSTVLLIIHLMLALCLVGSVLLQRSEGGALGMGGGGGGGGLMSGRGAANMLTRITAVLTMAFFTTSILLTVVARQNTAPSTVLEQAGQQSKDSEKPGSSSVLPQLPPSNSTPTPTQAPTPPAPASN